jgi:16S rRNA (guanine527-N7)-methyltransferase
MSQFNRQRVKDGVQQLGLTVTETQVERWIKCLQLIHSANEHVNLTAIREPDAMIDKHLLDSLTVVPWLSGQTIVDLGTGGGFPGLPLAIFFPDKQFILVDSIAKKIKVVQAVATQLGLQNVRTEVARGESLKGIAADTVVARAVASLSDLGRYARNLTKSGGQLLAMKGRLDDAEMADLPKGFKLVAVKKVMVPGLSDERHVVRFIRA